MSGLVNILQVFLLIGILYYLFIGLAFIGVIVGIVFLINHLVNKHRAPKQNQTNVAPNASAAPAVAPQNSSAMPTTQPTPNTTPTRAAPKKTDPYAKYNILLICGSVFLVFAIVSFMNTVDDSLVAPSVIVLTLLFYVLGLVIYKLVDYLKPVGLTFIYTATAVFPFWVIALCSCGMDTQSAWISCSIFSFVAFTGTSLLTKTKILPVLSYLWLPVIAWTCTPSWNTALQNYWIYLAPTIMSFVPVLLYCFRPTWLPKNFRPATKIAAFGLFPLLFLWSLALYVMPNVAVTAPILRTLMALSTVVYALIFWSKERSHAWLIACRIAIQCLLCACIADIINFSIFSPTRSTILSTAHTSREYHWLNLTSDDTKLIICIVWIISCLAQALLSIFAIEKSKKNAKIEHIAEIVSLVGLFITPALIMDNSNDISIGAISLIVDLILVALGVTYTKLNKNIFWGVATLVGAALIPSALATGLIGNWSNVGNLFYFTFYGAFVLLAYNYLGKKQPEETKVLTVLALTLASIVVLASASVLNYPELGWLIVSLFLAGFGYLRKSTNLMEASIYGGALCVFSLIGTIMDTTASSSYLNELSFRRRVTILDAVRCYVIPIALLGVSYWRERGIAESSRWRFILGYIILSISLIMLGMGGNSEWLLLSAMTQAGFLVYAATTGRDWLIWSSIIIIVGNMLTITGVYTWMGFAIVGIALIAVVIWQMSKQNKPKQSAELERTERKPEEAKEDPKDSEK